MSKFVAACSNCGKTFSVSTALGGKKAKCNRCQTVFVVSEATDRVDRAQRKPAVHRSAAAQQKTSVKANAITRGDSSQPRTTRSAALARSSLGSGNAGSPANKGTTDGTHQKLDANSKIKHLKRLLGEASIKTGRVSLLYRINVLITSLLMLLLPIVYVCMIVAVGYLTYYHAANNAGIIGTVRGRAVIITGMVYVAPIIGGIVLVFFMIKPLLARPGTGSRKRKINSKGEPVLCWFVEQVCESVGAPVPRQIYLTHDINASASFENGMRSALLGRNLTLHIGVPLVGGLSLQQFGGVLAHEFGHFSQGAGMRLSTFIRNINFWFARVVYERDAWDEGLASLVDEDTDFRLALLIWFAQLCVFLSRGFLWILMMIGHIASSFLLRQMEFDADKYEVQFAGSDNFKSTSDRLQILGAAYQLMIPSIIDAAIKGKTVKNLPKMITNKTAGLDPKIIREILHHSHTAKTGLFDSHPSDAQRIERAMRANAEGVFKCDAPAALLFSNFDLTARGITDDFYRNEFGVTKQTIRKAKRR